MPSVPIPPRSRHAAAVLAGGAVGTAARLAVGEAFATTATAFPWHTLTVNLIGAAVLGFLLPRLQAGARSTQYTIPLLAIGALGAFTTFSGFAVEIVELADNGKTGTAAIYATVSLVAGLALALAGRRLGGEDRMTWILAIVAGGVGALARYVATGWVQRRLDTTLPWGTAAVNLTGAAVLGLLVGLGTLSEPAMRIVALGFLGGYTTFSTWMVESILLAEEGGRAGIRAGALNTVGLFAAGITATTIGFVLGQWV